MATISDELRAPVPAPVLNSGKTLCLTAYVYGNYQDYIPLFVYSTLLSYPEYYVRIFLRETLDPGNSKALDLVRSKVSDRFDVRENYFSDVRSGHSVLLKTLRWLIPPEDFNGFDCVYIGDVDFLVLRQQPTLLEKHLGYCQEQGLPYSNAVRVKNPPVKKMSGLHFIIVEPYFRAMGDVIAEEREAILAGERTYPDVASNEFILYDLIERGIGRFPPLWFRPPPGMHLGYARTGEISAKFVDPWKELFLDQVMRQPEYKALKPLLKRKQRRELARVESLATGQWWRQWV